MKAVRYVFAHGAEEHIVEFTHPDGPLASTEEWAASHIRSHARAVAEREPGRAIRVEVFDTDIPLDRGDWLKAQK